ncbi:MAG: CpsD/CapB family tyrosine-protein kinase [Solirubrobacterales bacterium]
MFAGVMLIGVLVALLPAKQYRSTVTMLVQPKSQDLLAISSAADFLTPPVIERVGSDQFKTNVQGTLPPGDRNADLTLSAQNQAGTTIVFVRADSTDPRVAEQAARSAAQRLIANPVSAAVSLSILTPAGAASSIASTRRAVILLGSAALGLIAAILAAVAAGAMRPRSSSAEFVTERFGLTVLGEIPARRNMPMRTRDVFNGTGPADLMESFEKLAVNVEIAAGEHPTLAVTSWAQGEGKTVATAQLAWALASLDYQVTAVDCDLRKPSLHRYLQVDPKIGVADLAKEATMRSVRQRTALRTLDVIAAGQAKDSHPAEIIGPAVDRMVTELARRTVLIDTPPLFGAETSLIAARVDAVILVVDARSTQPLELRDALRDLKLSNARVLGAVLNRAPQARRRRGTYRYYSRSAQARSKT